MALDEPQTSDQIFESKGLTFLVDKELLQKAKPITVDFIESVRGSGFAISSGMMKGGGCGGSCSC